MSGVLGGGGGSWVQECVQSVANALSAAVILHKGLADDYEETKGVIYFAKSIVERIAGKSDEEPSDTDSVRRLPVVRCMRAPSGSELSAAPRRRCPSSCTTTLTSSSWRAEDALWVASSALMCCRVVSAAAVRRREAACAKAGVTCAKAGVTCAKAGVTCVAGVRLLPSRHPAQNLLRDPHTYPQPAASC
jgi:hypothetical protein